MANIIELHDKSNEQLVEMIDNFQEEMFNLRFQKASRRLTNTARLRTIRREIAQVKTVLGNREVAIESALSRAEVAKAVSGKSYDASAKYDYEARAYNVNFAVEGTPVASAIVDLNKKQPSGRKARESKGFVSRVQSFEVK